MLRSLVQGASSTTIRLFNERCAASRNVFVAGAQRTFGTPTATGENLKSSEEIEKMVKSDKVVTFIKGVPAEPMCGFSRVVVQILNMHGVKFKSFDVLADDSLRQGMKSYSNWPTFPQVYVDGKFVGGADILIEMHKSKEIVDLLKTVGITSQYSEDSSATDKKK